MGVFPGPIFPGPIFPEPIFPGKNIEASLSSVSATAAVGTILPRTHKTLPGVEFSAAVGFITTVANTVSILSGVDATAAVGSVTVGDRSKGLTGTTATTAVGSVTKSDGIQLTGVTATARTGTGTSGGNAWGGAWGDAWGDSWGSSTVPDDPGIGNVVPNIAVTLPGNEVDVTVDAVLEIRLQALTGVTLQAQSGFVAADPNAVGSLTGVAVQVEVGTLQAPLVGSEVTVSVGTVVANIAFGLTGVEATATNGTLSAGGAPLLTGVYVQNDLQSLLIAPTINLSSVTVTVAVGSIEVPTQLASLTGVDLEADVETLALETSVVLSGVDVTADVNIVTTTADRERELTGVVVSVDVGFITAQNDILASLTGVDIDAAVGTLTALGIKTLGDVNLSAAVGTIVPIPHRTASLSGVAVTVQAGAVRRDSIPLSGVAASAAVESLGEPLLIRVLNSLQVTVNVGHTPKEGDVILDTVGVVVGAGSVGVLGVIPAAPVGMYRHSGPMPIRKRAVKELETLEREMALMEE